MFSLKYLFKTKIKLGDTIVLTGGYDMNPEWLNDKKQRCAVVHRFMQGQNKSDALVVQFKESFDVEGCLAKYAILELRYKGAQWFDGEICHVEICDFESENRPWQKPHGKWVESHATIRLMKCN